MRQLMISITVRNQYNYSALSWESSNVYNLLIVSYLKQIPKDVKIVFRMACRITIIRIVSYYLSIISSIEFTRDGMAYPIYSSKESAWEPSSSLSTFLWVICI